jgi:hypothetical protein
VTFTYKPEVPVPATKNPKPKPTAKLYKTQIASKTRTGRRIQGTTGARGGTTLPLQLRRWKTRILRTHPPSSDH